MLRLPLPRAPENVTVGDEPLTDRRMHPEVSARCRRFPDITEATSQFRVWAVEAEVGLH